LLASGAAPDASADGIRSHWSRLSQVRRALLLHVWVVALAAAAAGCERGCLARRLAGDRGADARAGVDLSGTDCPAGLARCVAGRVEVSRAAYLPHPCEAPGADDRRACACPWDVAAACAAGCAAEGVEVIVAADVAAAQLCTPDAPVARPPSPIDPALVGVCSVAEVRCEAGVVRICDGPGLPVRPLAVCLAGCEPAVGWLEGEPGERATGAGAGAILCRRQNAERR
jgi:hypothetical protein